MPSRAVGGAGARRSCRQLACNSKEDGVVKTRESRPSRFIFFLCVYKNVKKSLFCSYVQHGKWTMCCIQPLFVMFLTCENS